MNDRLFKAEDLEMGGVEKEVEDTEVRNIGMIDKIVFYFFRKCILHKKSQ